MTERSSVSRPGVAAGLMAAALASGTPTPLVALAQESEASASRSPERARSQVALGTSAFDGQLLQVDGKSPLAGVAVALRNAAGEVVARGQTDAEGRFAFEAQPEGDYLLEVGRARGQVRVEAEATARSLVLVLPEAVAHAVTSAQGSEETVTFLFWDMSREAAVVSYVVLGAVVVGGTVGIVLATQSGGGSSRRDAPPDPITPTDS